MGIFDRRKSRGKDQHEGETTNVAEPPVAQGEPSEQSNPVIEEARLLRQQERLLKERFGDTKYRDLSSEQRLEYDDIAAFYKRKIEKQQMMAKLKDEAARRRPSGAPAIVAPQNVSATPKEKGPMPGTIVVMAGNVDFESSAPPEQESIVPTDEAQPLEPIPQALKTEPPAPPAVMTPAGDTDAELPIPSEYAALAALDKAPKPVAPPIDGQPPTPPPGALSLNLDLNEPAIPEQAAPPAAVTPAGDTDAELPIPSEYAALAALDKAPKPVAPPIDGQPPTPPPGALSLDLDLNEPAFPEQAAPPAAVTPAGDTDAELPIPSEYAALAALDKAPKPVAPPIDGQPPTPPPGVLSLDLDLNESAVPEQAAAPPETAPKPLEPLPQAPKAEAPPLVTPLAPTPDTSLKQAEAPQEAATPPAPPVEAQAPIEPLLLALKNKDGRVRKDAAISLGQMRDRRAVEALIEALKDKDARVRSEVAIALGYIGDTRAVEPLIQALKDKNSYIGKEAAWALGKIRDVKLIEPLIQALSDERWEIKKEAAIALGEIGNQRAIEPMIRALTDKNTHFRKALIWALGQMGDKRAADALTPFLDIRDKSLREAAQQALEILKGKGITPTKRHGEG